ncbi:CotH kinase family protein [Neolewinella antarctica]|uniref:Bacterial repeat domain-containing protein n=1 Tax=Neolewinella antarctica TaxID=442734 RepID=A0ABX0XE25_9BACT|nr:CotH kinase family protein [Neolewinella antarctica]NJC27566.1 hypothetical protein [Neolewinella antarctica]
MPTGTRSVFLRQTFDLTDPATVRELLLDVDYDDGFVAYVNGREIARANLRESRPGYDATASSSSEGRLVDGGQPVRYAYRELSELLRTGENVLAIQVHNLSSPATDLTIAAFLSARFAGPVTDGTAPPDLLGLASAGPHTNFKLNSEGETLYLHDDRGIFVDSLTVAGIPSDVAVGIPPSGGEPLLYEVTTPGARNPETGFSGAVGGDVLFSQAGGLSTAFALTLSGAGEGEEIRYTTNATLPVATSERYDEPIQITRNTVIRARIFGPGKLPSAVQTQTYLVGVDHDIDVVTLVTEPDNFFDGKTGIYVLGDDYDGKFPYFDSNIWQDKEVPLHFSFIPKDGGEVFYQDLGTKVFGGYSRARSQRSLSLFARSRYGDGDMDYAFFPNRSYDEYESLVLRNGGNDWLRSMIRDVTMTGLMDGSGLDVQAFRPVATYLNGRYWGFYNLREKVNEDFLAARHGVDPDEVDILEWDGAVVEGSNLDYLELIDFASTNDLSEEANYRRVTDEIDVDNYLLYQVAQIYYANRDWPGNNVKYWRAQTPGAKWRWILFDTDFGAALLNNTEANSNMITFTLATSGTGRANPLWSTVLFRNLMANRTFRDRFINQMADETNSRFRYANVNELITNNKDYISKEIPKALRRWNQRNNFARSTNDIRTFFRERPGNVQRHVRDYFNLRANHAVRVVIDDTAEGYVVLNSLTLEGAEWTGDYYEGVPIKLTAVARAGYSFSHWELGSDATTATITVDLNSSTSFRPIFRSTATSVEATRGLASLVNVTDFSYSPNPASAVARLAFTTLRGTRVRAQLFDVRGVLVTTFVDQELAAGSQTFSADVSQLPAGAYQLRITENESRSGVVTWVLQ